MNVAGARLLQRCGLVSSMALALLLCAMPLPRLSAAAHDPVGSGAGMGTRVPLMFETGARVAAPGTATGNVRLPGLVAHGPQPLRPARSAAVGAAGQVSGDIGGVRLVSVGRLQLEGG